MTSHRAIYTDAQWADLRRGPTAAIYRVSLATLSVAADVVREYRAANAALYDFVMTKPMKSLVAELFIERLCLLDLTQMVAKHCTSEQSLEYVTNSARLIQIHHPDVADSYTTAVMTAVCAAADAVKEISIPGFRRRTEAEEHAMFEILEALHCRAPQLQQVQVVHEDDEETFWPRVRMPRGYFKNFSGSFRNSITSSR